jgi:hypothetical protein
MVTKMGRDGGKDVDIQCRKAGCRSAKRVAVNVWVHEPRTHEGWHEPRRRRHRVDGPDNDAIDGPHGCQRRTHSRLNEACKKRMAAQAVEGAAGDAVVQGERCEAFGRTLAREQAGGFDEHLNAHRPAQGMASPPPQVIEHGEDIAGVGGDSQCALSPDGPPRAEKPTRIEAGNAKPRAEVFNNETIRKHVGAQAVHQKQRRAFSSLMVVDDLDGQRRAVERTHRALNEADNRNAFLGLHHVHERGVSALHLASNCRGAPCATCGFATVRVMCLVVAFRAFVQRTSHVRLGILLSRRQYTASSYLALTCLLATLASAELGCSSKRPSLERLTQNGLVDPADFPDAAAVLLLDRSEVTIAAVREGERPMAELVHTQRIQVLSERGKAFARVLVPFDERTRVWSIEGRVLHADGRETRMNEAAIVDVDRFTDGPQAKLYDGPGYKLAKVPQVEVGDIFEVTTLLRIRDPRWLEPLVVGGDLPFVRGEVVLNVQDGLDVDTRVTLQGEVRDRRPSRIPTSLSMVTLDSPLPETRTRGVRFVWLFHREPALYPEGSGADLASLATQVHVLLRSGPGAFRSIDDIAAWYREITQGMDQPDADVRRLAATLRGGKMDKVKAIQRFVQDEVADTPTFGNLAALRARTPGDVIHFAVGDSKDQASLTLALLRAAGIDGNAVLLSRLGSFASIPDLPTPAPFNHVVVAVPMGGSYAYLDPATPGLPVGRLPAALQGGVGVLVTQNSGEFVNLPEDDEQKNSIDVRVTLTVAKDGRAQGTCEATLTGAEASRAHAVFALPVTEQPAALQALLLGERAQHSQGGKGVVFDAVSRDDNTFARTDSALTVRALLRPVAWDEKLVDPERLLGHPYSFLWREGRRTPVYLGVRRTWTVRLDVALPENLGVVELPVSVEKAGPIIDVAERWSIANGVLSFQRTLTNHERVVPAPRYDDLRAPVVASWARAARGVRLVTGGDRGTAYGTDDF